MSPVERSILIAAEDGGEIEAEAVDVHLAFPTAQAVHHHLAHVPPAEVQGVAGTRVICVRVGWVRRHHVVAGAVEALIAVSWTTVISLAGVVVHHIQYDPDACLMKGLHHVLEFKVLAVRAGARVLRMWRKEVQRHVAPVVTFLRIALKNWHQLDNRDPKLLQIWDFFHQSGIRSSTRWIYP